MGGNRDSDYHAKHAYYTICEAESRTLKALNGPQPFSQVDAGGGGFA